MDLSLAGIYFSAFKGVRKNPFVYLLLLIWTLIITVILTLFTFLGSSIYLGSVMVILMDESAGSSAFYLTVIFLGIFLLIISILMAATKAGFMAFGSAIRKGDKPVPLHFFKGILRFTLPLFIGGLVVAMLTAIPFLAFINLARISFSGTILDIFTSGWNFRQAVDFIHYLHGMAQIAALCNVVIFFWITPWDEMVVLYELPYSEALAKSFTFVFSRKHFFRVLALIIVNVLISQILLLLTNIGTFSEEMINGYGFAYISVLLNSSQNIYTTFVQFILYPFFIYTQLYLLPWSGPREVETAKENIDLQSVAQPPSV